MNISMEIEALLDRLMSHESLLAKVPKESLESLALQKIQESAKAHLLFLLEQASKERNLFSFSRKLRCMQKISALESLGNKNFEPLKKILNKNEFHLRKNRLRNKVPA